MLVAIFGILGIAGSLIYVAVSIVGQLQRRGGPSADEVVMTILYGVLGIVISIVYTGIYGVVLEIERNTRTTVDHTRPLLRLHERK